MCNNSGNEMVRLTEQLEEFYRMDDEGKSKKQNMKKSNKEKVVKFHHLDA